MAVSLAKSFEIEASRENSFPRSFSHAARIQSGCALDRVCMSASFHWIAWCCPMGTPNVLRSLA